MNTKAMTPSSTTIGAYDDDEGAGIKALRQQVRQIRHDEEVSDARFLGENGDPRPLRPHDPSGGRFGRFHEYALIHALRSDESRVCVEYVTLAAHSLKINRIGWIGSDFTPETVDLHVDGPFAAGYFIAAAKLVTLDGRTALLGELAQKIAFPLG